MENLTIDLEKDQTIYFTSDLHFNHRNMIDFCNRPYSDIKEMNEGIINSWNDTVTDNDIVFILGDVNWFDDGHITKKLLSQLNGKHIYIVPGNHDNTKKVFRLLDSRFTVLSDITHLFIVDLELKKQYKYVLSHYPLLTWAGRNRGAINLFGHIHSQEGKTEGFDQDLNLYPNQHYDVGVDLNNYKPIAYTFINNKLNNI